MYKQTLAELYTLKSIGSRPLSGISKGSSIELNGFVISVM